MLLMMVLVEVVLLFGARSGAIWSKGSTEMKERHVMWAGVKETASLHCLFHSAESLRLAMHLSQCSSPARTSLPSLTPYGQTKWQRIGFATTKRYSSGQVTGFCRRLSERALRQLCKKLNARTGGHSGEKRGKAFCYSIWPFALSAKLCGCAKRRLQIDCNANFLVRKTESCIIRHR